MEKYQKFIKRAGLNKKALYTTTAIIHRYCWLRRKIPTFNTNQNAKQKLNSAFAFYGGQGPRAAHAVSRRDHSRDRCTTL